MNGGRKQDLAQPRPCREEGPWEAHNRAGLGGGLVSRLWAGALCPPAVEEGREDTGRREPGEEETS